MDETKVLCQMHCLILLLLTRSDSFGANGELSSVLEMEEVEFKLVRDLDFRLFCAFFMLCCFTSSTDIPVSLSQHL